MRQDAARPGGRDHEVEVGLRAARRLRDAEPAQLARHRLLEENYYIPLKTFASMGMRPFQTDPNITRNYSQASGLAHFLLHHADGRYRDALIQHLSQIYTPGRRISISPLQTLTGVDTIELDRQYRRYLTLQQSELSSSRERTPRQ